MGSEPHDQAEAEEQVAALEKQLAETEGWDDIDPEAVKAFVGEHDGASDL